MAKTYYEILQVLPDASPEVIRAAYRTLSAKYHPDRDPSPASCSLFKQIQTAFEVLSDPIQRQNYDAKCESKPEGNVQPSATSEQTEFVPGENLEKKKRRWGRIVLALGFLCLLAAVAARQSGLVPYINPDSGIVAYEYGSDWIRVQFKDGDTYEYWANKIGQGHINEMKRLADSGNGLNTYINTHREVKHGWQSRQVATPRDPARVNGLASNTVKSRATPLNSKSRESEKVSSKAPIVSFTGRWQTSNGDTVKLIEHGNTINIELLASSTMASGTGVLSRSGSSIWGTLTGAFHSAPTRMFESTFIGTVKSRDRIEYTVDSVHFIGQSSLTTEEKKSFFMSRMSY